MSTFNFATATAVKYGTTVPKKIMVGATQVWPKASVGYTTQWVTPPANWNGRDRCKFTNDTMWDGTPFPSTMPQQTIQLKVSDRYGLPAVNGGGIDNLNQQSEFLCLSDDGVTVYGTSSGATAANYNAYQTRYGGTVQLPTATKPGDVLYWIIGMDPAYWTTAVLKIEIIA
jgi:hypothetical protein